MSSAQRLAFTSAWVRMADGSAGAQIQARYRNLIDTHQALWTTGGLHQQTQFLPWHRMYVTELESVLRQVDPSITMPYWASERDGQDFGMWGSPVWDDADGLGSTTGGACMASGPFRQGEYSITPYGAAFSTGTCIRRRRTGVIPGVGEYRQIQAIRSNAYSQFVRELDAVHGAVHCVVHGTMCEPITVEGQRSFIAANDPIFFLHHANIDKHWATWQSQSTAHANALDVNPTTLSLPGLGATGAQVMSISNINGVCVRYDDPLLGLASDGEASVAVSCPLEWSTAGSEWWAGNGHNQSDIRTRLSELETFYCSQSRVPPVA